MRHLDALAASVAVSLLASCAHGPRGEAVKPPDCALEYYWDKPKRPFTVLGTVSEFVTGRMPGAPPDALKPQACALGADAVLVTRDVADQLGHAHLAGEAIRFDAEPPPPAAAQPSTEPPSTAL
ncbi:MAG: hypothetical protein ACJ79E_08710 [Anaeromyxobacteraceae bacterium]